MDRNEIKSTVYECKNYGGLIVTYKDGKHYVNIVGLRSDIIVCIEDLMYPCLPNVIAELVVMAFQVGYEYRSKELKNGINYLLGL